MAEDKGTRSLEGSTRWLMSCVSALVLTTSAYAYTGEAQAQQTQAPQEDPAFALEEVVEAAQPSAIAQFTTAVENREPIDQVTFVPNEVRTIYFFSDLRAMAGQTIVHRWIFKGETMAEVPFEVRGPRWRVWSSKDLQEDWIGDWTVEIVNGAGETIAAETFTYSAPGA